MQDPQASMNAALSVEPYGMRFGDKKSTWAKRTDEAIKPRVDEIQERENLFEKLKNDIQTRQNERLFAAQQVSEFVDKVQTIPTEEDVQEPPSQQQQEPVPHYLSDEEVKNEEAGISAEDGPENQYSNIVSPTIPIIQSA